MMAHPSHVHNRLLTALVRIEMDMGLMIVIVTAVTILENASLLVGQEMGLIIMEKVENH